MKKKICLCMGSSCYKRGNREYLARIQDWIKTECAGEVELSGSLCQGNCQKGSNPF